MKLRFLGTNGWYPTKTGNTICVAVETPKFVVIFDAGDGIHKLNQEEERPVYLFLSHFHLDHTSGLHILNKFKFKKTLTIFGQPGTKKFLKKFINPPYTVPLNELKFRVRFQDLEKGRYFPPETPFPFECRFLLHSIPCFGYRIELDGKGITYCTDTGVCDNLIKLSRNADVLIAECSIPWASLVDKKWPHLYPEEAASLAKKAGVKRLFLVHFDASFYPSLKDRKETEKRARKIFPQTLAAFDDMEVEI